MGRLTKLISLLVVLGGWQVMSLFAPSMILPGPYKVISALYQILISGEFLTALKTSIAAMAIGGGLAIGIGIPLGILMGVKRRVEDAVGMYVSALYVAPMAALIPVLIFWFGVGMAVRIVYVFLFSVFEVVITCYHGAKDTPARLVEVARSFGASERDIFRKVTIPHEIPFIITAGRLGAGRAVRGMVIAELIVAATGLGDLIGYYSAAFRLDVVMAVVMVLMLMGIALTALIKQLEYIIAPWKRGMKAF